ncbi:MAG: Fe-S protein assembly chaperone HscA [Planctomycetota bacterium]|jgi:Fe-S protein assembly chaperone HscA
MGYIELDMVDNRPKDVVIGIDLGTTNSLAAIWLDGRPQILRKEGQSGVVPSIVSFQDGGETLVGKRARDQSIVDPSNTIFSIKRFMGRGIGDLGDQAGRLPYQVSETERGLVQIDIRGKMYTPQEISALILREVVQRASEAYRGAEITKAVITVPAYFDDAQRQATRDAARLAGLEVLRIVNEPTAASLAYGIDQKGEGTVAVFDLGGGTFDVSILSIEEGVFQVLATCGDTQLGGDDFDQCLVGMMRRELAGVVGDDVLSNPTFTQAARLVAERCKIELTLAPEYEIHLSLPELDLNWRRTVQREEFEACIEPMVQQTIDACKQAMADAKLSPDGINEVVLVGGSTRVPAVRRAVEEFFGRKPHTELNPDEVVALGAAAQAQVLMGGTREILLLDVTPLSLGLETVGGAVSKLIQRNSTVPCSITEGFTTYAENQTGIDFHILQGEREMASDCRTLGRFKLSGIPPMPAGMPRVAVKFHIDADGVLTVTAKEDSTGVRAEIEVLPMHGLTSDEVDTMVDESLEHAREDFDNRRAVDLKAEIGTMLNAVHKNLATARTHLDKETIDDLNQAITASQGAQDTDDLEVIKVARDQLEQATLPLAAVLMDAVVKEAVTGKTLGEV